MDYMQQIGQLWAPDSLEYSIANNLSDNLQGNAWDALGAQRAIEEMANQLRSKGATSWSALEAMNPLERRATFRYGDSIGGLMGAFQQGSFYDSFAGDDATRFAFDDSDPGNLQIRSYGFGSSDKQKILGGLAALAFPFAAGNVVAGLGGAAGGGGAGAAGMSGAGFGDAGMMYAGADAAAAGSLGGGASVGGGAALGGGAAAVGAGAGLTGLEGAGAADLMYAGADAASAGSLGGGASVAGGSALGTASTMPSWLQQLGSGAQSLISSPGGGVDYSKLLGLASTALGAYGGSQGVDNSASSTRAMDPRMDSLFYGDLAPRTQGMMIDQLPWTRSAGADMVSLGMGLLKQKEPTTATNPYATGILSDMQRRNGELIDQRLQGIAGNSVGVGGLGGSRQGIAQANAISQGADNFAGQGLNFMGGLYNADQNRLRQDWTLGAGMVGQGFDTQFKPLQNAAQIYSPFNGFGTTTNNQNTGGGWQGGVGGALAGASMGRQMGWW
jgi:hypothetical protein